VWVAWTGMPFGWKFAYRLALPQDQRQERGEAADAAPGTNKNGSGFCPYNLRVFQFKRPAAWFFPHGPSGWRDFDGSPAARPISVLD